MSKLTHLKAGVASFLAFEVSNDIPTNGPKGPPHLVRFVRVGNAMSICTLTRRQPSLPYSNPTNYLERRMIGHQCFLCFTFRPELVMEENENYPKSSWLALSRKACQCALTQLVPDNVKWRMPCSTYVTCLKNPAVIFTAKFSGIHAKLSQPPEAMA